MDDGYLMTRAHAARPGSWWTRLNNARRRIQGHALDEYPLLVAGVELSLVVLSNYAAFWLRYDGDIPAAELETFAQTIGMLVAIRAVVFIPCRLYMGMWQYTGLFDLVSIVGGVTASSGVFYVLLTRAMPTLRYSPSVIFIDAMLLIGLLSAVRLSKRLILQVRRTWTPPGRRVLILGAGDAGQMLVHEMQYEPSGYEPVGFIDDDPVKRGQRIHGVPVLGNRGDLTRVVEEKQPDEVVLAMPSADATVMRSVVEVLRPLKVPITTLPSVRDILDGRVAVHQIRQLRVEDLLPRAPVDLDTAPVRALLSGKSVLVTGAGGSIGSELSRQIAALGPSKLILYERYENGLYSVMNDLTDRFGGSSIVPVIGDVTDAERVDQVLASWRPDIIFHAAAHKHVPLMEHNPCEAIKNNVVGTATVADAADRWRVDQFIMISTDKAVNPSSVMGASKRVGEMILQVLGTRSDTTFTAVRFGNVLGSSGSVVPRFLEQIRAGGPVTVTHPEIRRFFMLIPEAVQLVLHAAAIGERGMVYVLEMGEQISLLELARNMIRLAGFIPDEEIPITFVGLRPGEKLYEELVGAEEATDPSPVPKILRVRGGPPADGAALEAQIGQLVEHALRGESDHVIRQLRTILPTFQPPDGTAGLLAALPPPDLVMNGAAHARRALPQRDANGRFTAVH